jgi:YVTN family beta-propeller protein
MRIPLLAVGAGFLSVILGIALAGCGASLYSTPPNSNPSSSNPIPTISSISPSSLVFGSTPQNLTINGSGFISSSSVSFNGTAQTTNYVSGSQLTIALTTAEFTSAGNFNVVVMNPSPGGGASNSTVFSVDNPVPGITYVSPGAASVGSAAEALTVNGLGFVSSSTANFNGTARPTSFVSTTQLTVMITAGDQASVGTENITVSNPSPGGGTSSSVPFAVLDPIPTITSISPSSLAFGSTPQNLTISGSGFISSSSVSFNGTAQTTNYVSGSQLTIALTTAELASIGNFNVVVMNPTPGGGSSSAATFTVGNPVPRITSVSPGAASVGSAAETLTVNGSGFISSSTANFNGTPRPTSFVGTTQLTVMITAGDQASAGTDSITVSNPIPGGGPSNSVPFPVLAPIAVQVSVVATDLAGNPLSYRWKATDGTIVDANSPSTTWALADGPGLHFAYVLVSNGKGGYTERRVAVNTDSIGTPMTIPSPISLAPPPAPAPASDIYRSFVNWGGISVADIPVYLKDSTSGTVYPASGTVMTNLRGEFLIPAVPPLTSYKANCSVDGGLTITDCTSVEPYQGWPPPPPPSAAATDYAAGDIVPPSISGSMTLQDGSSCGAVNEFFGIQVTGTAVLRNSSGTTLAGPVRLNEYGEYSLPFNAATSSVLLQCETAAAVSVAVVNPVPTGTFLPSATLTGVSAPTVLSMSATQNGTEVGTFLPPPSGFPSDFYPSADQFLAGKGLDTRVGACQYYKAIGAVASCDAAGNPSGAINFEDWKRTVKIDSYAPVGAPPTFTATYINKVDLNLARDHHSITYGPSQTAAYVCNHLGPTVLDPNQSVDAPNNPSIDTVVANAASGKNLVACVAMDNNVTPGVNVDSHGVAQPFTRFLIFGPSGQLLPSINLDGRREKFVPGTCVVCHGGDHYAGKFPEDGTGAADVGGHFVPYDVGNFEFSSKPGLTEADQEQAIYHLNQNLLNAAPTVAERELIAGWYAAGQVLDKKYLPTSWQNQSAAAIAFYQNVHARSCRTCHVVLVEGYNFDHYQNITPGGKSYRESSPGSALEESVATNFHRRGHSMPNSLVTFNRFWQSAGTPVDQPGILKQFFLTDPTIPETTGNVTVVDGSSNTATTITAGVGPLAINSASDKIYVPNRHSNTVTVIDGATGTVTATVPEGTGPHAVAVNPVTNKIYVANSDSQSVGVIDGVSNTVTATIPLSVPPGGFAVNSVTNKIYGTPGDTSGTGVTVIDGASNTVTATVPFGGFVSSLVINSVTNEIYMTTNSLVGTNYIGNIIVIDGASDTVAATIPLGGFAGALAINSVTNKVYVSTGNSSGYSNVTVINGATNTITATLPLGVPLYELAINSVTNKIYASTAVVVGVNISGYNVTVINGASDTVATTIPLGGSAFGLATNSVTNRIYVPIAIIVGSTISGYAVTVIDGTSNSVIATVPVGLNPSAVTVNSVTNKVYVDVE